MQEWGDSEISEKKPGKIGFPPALIVLKGYIYRQEKVEFQLYPHRYRWKMTIWNDLGKFICYFRDNPDCSEKSIVRLMGLPTTYDLGKGSILIDCMTISTDQYHSFMSFVRKVFNWMTDYITKYRILTEEYKKEWYKRKKEGENEEN